MSIVPETKLTMLDRDDEIKFSRILFAPTWLSTKKNDLCMKKFVGIHVARNGGSLKFNECIQISPPLFIIKITFQN